MGKVLEFEELAFYIQFASVYASLGHEFAPEDSICRNHCAVWSLCLLSGIPNGSDFKKGVSSLFHVLIIDETQLEDSCS